MNRIFLVRIEQPGRVSYLAVQGQRNALHLGQAYARQAPTQQILVLNATGRLRQAVHRDDLRAAPPEKTMAEEKRIPLDELLFGPKVDPTAKLDPTLAEVISSCYREGLAKSLRDQAAQRSSLAHPAGEPKR